MRTEYIVVAVLVALVVGSIISMVKAERDFMAECTKDHKQYECTAMYRSAHPAPTVIVMPR